MKSLFKLTFRSILSLLLIISVVSSVYASGPSITGTLSSSFTTTGYQSQIDVTDLTLKSGESSVTTLSPTATYKVGFTVSNTDGLQNMKFRVVLYNDLEGTFNPATVEGTTIDGDVLVFDYNAGATTPSVLIDYAEVALDSNTTWHLWDNNTSGFSNAEDPTSYTFSIDVIISRIAQATSTWKLIVYVESGDTTPSTDNISFGSSIEVSWYGAISIEETEVEGIDTMTWGEVAYNTSYNTAGAEEDVLVKYFSNGVFDTYASAYSAWSFIEQGSVHGTVYLDSFGEETGKFAIRINRIPFNIATSSGGYTTGSGFLQLSSSLVELDSDQPRTDEAGDLVTYYLYLKIGSGFQNGLYSGSIGFGISNPIPD
jgi:hypothetical protein